MINRADLWAAGNEALRELGLGWQIFYTDEEPETLIERQPAPGTAFNIRFNLATGDGRFLNLRLRLPAEHVTPSAMLRDQVRQALVARIRRDHMGQPQ